MSSATRSGADEAEGDAPAPEGGLKTWSDLGGLADKDFAAFTTDEIAEAGAAPVSSRLESW